MTEDNNYRPRSPDFSSLQFPPSTAPPDQYAPLTSPLAHRASYDASPFFSSNYQRPSSASRTPQQYVPPVPLTGFDPDMARRSSRLAPTDGAPVAAVPEPFHTPYAVESVAAPMMPEETHPQPGAGIEVKTKFPVARIKRIMQADEDVGKVAQVTPIAVSKALELFMISLVTKAAHEAKERNSKRVTAWHLKHAVAKDEVLDFLADIIAKVPDQPAGRKHEDEGSDQNEGRRKRGGRRPKEESD